MDLEYHGITIMLSSLPLSLSLSFLPFLKDHHKVGTKAPKTDNPPIDASISTSSTNTEPAVSDTSLPVETSSHFIQSKGEYEDQTNLKLCDTPEQSSDVNVSSSLKLLASAYSGSSSDSSEEGEILPPKETLNAVLLLTQISPLEPCPVRQNNVIVSVRLAFFFASQVTIGIPFLIPDFRFQIPSSRCFMNQTKHQ